MGRLFHLRGDEELRVPVHFDTVDACEPFLAEEWEGMELDAATASLAWELLADQEGKLLIQEPARAACLKRI